MKQVILIITIFLLILSARTSVAAETEFRTFNHDSLSAKLPIQTTSSELVQADTIVFRSDGNTVDVSIKQQYSGTVSADEFKMNEIKQKRPIALKTNLLYWVAATPNVSVEFYLSDRLSLNTQVDFAWWSSSASQFYWQIFSVTPELRYWFCNDRHFHGHYAGVYIGGALYDIMVKPITGNKGYQGEFYLSAGLSYGYMFPIGKNLSLEAGVSVGYMQTNYREYVWNCSEYMRTDTKRTTWIGPTKINLTLVWRIPR